MRREGGFGRRESFQGIYEAWEEGSLRLYTRSRRLLVTAPMIDPLRPIILFSKHSLWLYSHN